MINRLNNSNPSPAAKKTPANRLVSFFYSPYSKSNRLPAITGHTADEAVNGQVVLPIGPGGGEKLVQGDEHHDPRHTSIERPKRVELITGPAEAAQEGSRRLCPGGEEGPDKGFRREPVAW